MLATDVFYFVDKKEVMPVYENQNYILGVSKDAELRKMKGLDKIFDDQSIADRFCHQQISFMVIGEDLKMLDKQVNQASEALAKIGIVHVREDINLEKVVFLNLNASFQSKFNSYPSVRIRETIFKKIHLVLKPFCNDSTLKTL